jgi:hypothetical protein
LVFLEINKSRKLIPLTHAVKKSVSEVTGSLISKFPINTDGFKICNETS